MLNIKRFIKWKTKHGGIHEEHWDLFFFGQLFGGPDIPSISAVFEHAYMQI